MSPAAGEPDPRWRERGEAFDRSARTYELGRPGYPDELYTLLADRCGLRADSRVLEVGPGSGQATLPLLRLGARVTAVEPGAELARRLAERAQGEALEIVRARFEDVDLPEAGFDLVVSATAFHWVEPVVGYRKCADALADDGWLALWWTVFGDPDRPDPFDEALREILRAKAPQLITEGVSPLKYVFDTPARRSEIESVGAFGEIRLDVLKWEGRHDAAGLRHFFQTVSPWLKLPDQLFMELLDDVELLARVEFRNEVVRPYQTVLYTAQREHRG